MLRGFFTADSGASTGAGAAQADPPNKTEAIEAVAADEKRFTQAELEQQIKERLARQQRQFEAQQRDAQQALEAKQLEEQAEWQKLANRRADEVKELKPRAGLADAYEKAAQRLIEEQTRDLPAAILSLLEKLSPLDQLDWLAANAHTIKPQPASGNTNINAYGRGAGTQPALSDEEYLAKKRRETTYQ